MDLVAQAQVLVESFRPGTLEKMGLAPAALFAHNRKLIIARISGWGRPGRIVIARASALWSKACRDSLR